MALIETVNRYRFHDIMRGAFSDAGTDAIYDWMWDISADGTGGNIEVDVEDVKARFDELNIEQLVDRVGIEQYATYFVDNIDDALRFILCRDQYEWKLNKWVEADTPENQRLCAFFDSVPFEDKYCMQEDYDLPTDKISTFLEYIALSWHAWLQPTEWKEDYEKGSPIYEFALLTQKEVLEQVCSDNMYDTVVGAALTYKSDEVDSPIYDYLATGGDSVLKELERQMSLDDAASRYGNDNEEAPLFEAWASDAMLHASCIVHVIYEGDAAYNNIIIEK